MATERKSSGMQSAIRVLRTLEAVAEHQPIKVGELARKWDQPKSTVQRCLVTLAEAGWIWQNPLSDGAWSLTAHAASIGRRVEPALITAAQEPMRRLRDRTGETVHITVRDGQDSVIVDRAESSQVLRIARPFGDKTAMYATASGRSMLSLLSSEEIESLIPQRPAALTSDTETDRQAIKELVEEARRQGYAVNRGQNELGVCAIAAPIGDLQGRPLGAIVLSVPSFRFDVADLDHWSGMVRESATQISRNLGFSG